MRLVTTKRKKPRLDLRIICRYSYKGIHKYAAWKKKISGPFRTTK